MTLFVESRSTEAWRTSIATWSPVTVLTSLVFSVSIPDFTKMSVISAISSLVIGDETW